MQMQFAITVFVLDYLYFEDYEVFTMIRFFFLFLRTLVVMKTQYSVLCLMDTVH